MASAAAGASRRARPPAHLLTARLLWLPVVAVLLQDAVGLAQVTGASMEPTLNDAPSRAKHGNAIVVLNRFAGRWGGPSQWKRGDVVSLVSPVEPDLMLTKRILALPGDVLRIRPDSTTHALESSASSRASKPGHLRSLIRIPAGHAWLEGDASVAEHARDMQPGARPWQGLSQSRDSREFGPIPIGLLQARIAFVLWPPSRFGFPAPREEERWRELPPRRAGPR